MSKFTELCQAYSQAKQKTWESRQACQKFATVFISRMSDYFQVPIEQPRKSFNQALMYFETSLTLYEDPHNRENSASEVVIIEWSLEKILDNYILMIYPWMEQFKLFENEWDKFEQVYDLVFERIKEAYLGEINLPEEGKIIVRTLGLEFTDTE